MSGNIERTPLADERNKVDADTESKPIWLESKKVDPIRRKLIEQGDFEKLARRTEAINSKLMTCFCTACFRLEHHHGDSSDEINKYETLTLVKINPIIVENKITGEMKVLTYGLEYECSTRGCKLSKQLDAFKMLPLFNKWKDKASSKEIKVMKELLTDALGTVQEAGINKLTLEI